MIDNLAFVKFVLANRPMSGEEKMEFLDAAPKMTDGERNEYMSLILLEQVAGLTDEINEKEVDALLAGKDPDEEIEKFLKERGQKADETKISQVRERLKEAGALPKPAEYVPIKQEVVEKEDEPSLEEKLTQLDKKYREQLTQLKERAFAITNDYSKKADQHKAERVLQKLRGGSGGG